MATQFQETIEVSVVDQEDRIASMPVVPNYGAFQQSIVVVVEPTPPETVPLRLRGISIEPTTDYIYVTEMTQDSGRNGIHIFSQTGDYINTFGDTHLRNPWGILIHQDNIYVTDIGYNANAIFLFRLPDLKMIKKAGKRGSGREEFRIPRQLAISPNQHLYVADQTNHRLQILTTDLEFTDTLQHQTMFSPVDVKFSNNEMFVLSFRGSPCVHVFTLSGEKTRALGSRGMLVKEWFFCLDKYNNILINECSGDKIKVFSPHGDLLHTIRRRAGMNYGIAIDKNKIILNSCNYIRIFSA